MGTRRASTLALAATTLVAASALGGCAPSPGVAGRAEAITNGEVSPGDVAVVALMHGDQVYCSGAVVTPHFVLTAAHCVADAPPSEVLFVREDGSLLTMSVHGVSVDPDYDPVTLRADLGLVELDDAAPVPPLAMATARMDDGSLGAEVRVVGFGRSDPSESPGLLSARRSGTSTLAAYTAWNFTMTPGPSQTCVGDSGGPTLLDVDGVETIVGVHSFGDATCTSFATDVRVDRFVQSFVLPTMDAHADDFQVYGPAIVGQQCSVSGTGTAVWPVGVALAALAAVARRRRRRG